VASGLALAGFALIRYRGRLITGFLSRIMLYRIGAQPTRERVLIVGSGRTAEHIAWLLDHPTYSGKFQVVGFVDDDLLSQGMRIYGASILGTCKNIPELVQKHDVGLILLADHRLAYEEYQSISAACEGTSVRIAVVPDIFGSLRSLSEALSAYPQDGNGRILDDLRCIGCMAKYVPSGIESKLDE
jgi:FlaA1/EpsC-like NDP-sugar epimerase